MKGMKKLISIVTLLAFVITAMPFASHAAMDQGVSVKAGTSEHGDCHHSMTKMTTEKTAQNDKSGSGKCCDKGMCKCVGGNCHSLSQYLGNSGNSLSALSSRSAVFAFDNQFVDSALSNRLKRPPKA